MNGPTVWETLHFPVLKAVVDTLNADRTFTGVRANDLAASTGIEPEDIVAALRALEAGGFFEVHWTMPVSRAASVRHLTDRAQRAVGAWPSDESIADRIIAALEAIAENTTDEDERTRTRKILEMLAGSGRQIAVGVGTAIITGAVT